MCCSYAKSAAFLAIFAAAAGGLYLLEQRDVVEAAGTQAPRFEVDPMWPKPLPNHWIMGATIGVGVDAKDNVWVIHRGGSLEEKERYATWTPKASECCVPAPPVLAFSPAGDLIASWGGSDGAGRGAAVGACLGNNGQHAAPQARGSRTFRSTSGRVALHLSTSPARPCRPLPRWRCSWCSAGTRALRCLWRSSAADAALLPAGAGGMARRQRARCLGAGRCCTTCALCSVHRWRPAVKGGAGCATLLSRDRGGIAGVGAAAGGGRVHTERVGLVEQLQRGPLLPTPAARSREGLDAPHAQLRRGLHQLGERLRRGRLPVPAGSACKR